ncbi:MAG TPA: metallophosphoesterase family protein [Terriglobales bacterium]|nr:metallophosphoesterase family protein [Terriglobales bacterium]
MIFATGDTHGDFRRFGKSVFFEQRGMSKADYVVVCGDFGIWDGGASENYWLDWLDAKPFTTLFVTGNHSNYELLAACPTERWQGGNVQFVRPSVIHLMRGQVFDIGGKRFFTMGGASSHDIEDGILDPAAPDFKARRRTLDARGGMYRVNRVSWWKEELPSGEEYETALANLEACGWRVDYVVTHCCPSSIEDIVGQGRCRHDALTDFFEELKDKLDFDRWLFGHYHDNRVIAGKYILLYEQIVELK